MSGSGWGSAARPASAAGAGGERPPQPSRTRAHTREESGGARTRGDPGGHHVVGVDLVEGDGQLGGHALAPLPAQPQRRKVCDQQRGAGVGHQARQRLHGVTCGRTGQQQGGSWREVEERGRGAAGRWVSDVGERGTGRRRVTGAGAVPGRCTARPLESRSCPAATMSAPPRTLEQEEGDVELRQARLHEAQAAQHEAKLAGAGAQELRDLPWRAVQYREGGSSVGWLVGWQRRGRWPQPACSHRQGWPQHRPSLGCSPG